MLATAYAMPCCLNERISRICRIFLGSEGFWICSSWTNWPLQCLSALKFHSFSISILELMKTKAQSYTAFVNIHSLLVPQLKVVLRALGKTECSQVQAQGKDPRFTELTLEFYRKTPLCTNSTVVVTVCARNSRQDTNTHRTKTDFWKWTHLAGMKLLCLRHPEVLGNSTKRRY